MRRFSLFGVIFFWSVVGPGLGVLLLSLYVDDWYPYVKEMEKGKVVFFLFLGFLLMLFSFLPTHAVSLISGLLFGIIWGPILAMFSISLALLISYYLIYKLFDENLIKSIQRYKKAQIIYEDLIKKSGFKIFGLICLVRLSPVMPFAATNVVLGAAKVKFIPYSLGSIIGLCPRVVLVAVAGAGLQELDLSKGSDRSLFILGVVSTILVLFIIGKVFKNSWRKYIELENLNKNKVV